MFKNMKLDKFVEDYQVKMAGCMGCPRACFNYMRVPGSPPGGLFCSSYVLLSAPLWNPDLHTVWEAGILANTYCMDATELGGIISFMMELYTQGIITEKDTDGIPFEKGSKAAIIDAVHKIAKRESYGDLLADGIPRAAERIGRGAMDYAVHTKGLFPHGYVFRQLKGHSLLQAVGHKGGDPFPISVPLRFEVAWSLPQVNAVARKIGKERYGTDKAIDPSEYSDAKVDVVMDSEHAERAADLLGTCTRQVPGVIPESTALEAFNAATGMELNEQDLIGVEEKLVHLERAFDVREGIRRENDAIPKKWLTEKIDAGHYEGAIIDEKKHEKMKDTYYRKRGWNITTGIPGRETLESVGLCDIADDFAKLKI